MVRSLIVVACLASSSCAIDTGVPPAIAASLTGLQAALVAVAKTIDEGFGEDEVRKVVELATTMEVGQSGRVELGRVIDDDRTHVGFYVWVLHKRKGHYSASFGRTDNSAESIAFIHELGSAVPEQFRGRHP